MANTSHTHTSSMESSFPVVLPEDSALFLSDLDFEHQIHALLSISVEDDAVMTGNEAFFAKTDIHSTPSDEFTLVTDSTEAPCDSAWGNCR